MGSQVNSNDAWLNLRSSLAAPPGRAGETEERRAGTYVACLLQFEQLVHAATQVSAHSQALPLYYAAMHGAKALVAAFGDTPTVRGHGLEQATKSATENVMDLELSISGKNSTFHQLCQLTASALPKDRLRLADLFVSLPDLCEKPNTLSENPAIYVEEMRDPWEASKLPYPFVVVVLETDTLPPESELLKRYPTLVDWQEEHPLQRAITLRRQAGHVYRTRVPVDFRGRLATLDALAPTYRYSGDRWLRPAIAGLAAPLSPLASWYALLHGFSLLARYEPDVWMNTLDPRAKHAVAIEAALDEAQYALPELIWKEIAP